MRRLSLPMLLAVLLLAACGPGGETGSGPASEPPGSVSAAGEEMFVFTRDNLPRLDGSTSTAPLARAMCAVLLGEDLDQVAELVNFSRT